MKPEKLAWSLEWFRKDDEAFAGRLEIEFARVDAGRLKEALGLGPEAPFDGGFPVEKAAAVEYLRAVTGHAFDLDKHDYFIEILRVPGDA